MKSKVIGDDKMLRMDYSGLPFIYKVANLMNRFLKWFIYCNCFEIKNKLAAQNVENESFRVAINEESGNPEQIS